ncbi:hypothetical protein [Allorhizocola rhizosphaerae]|uniref:hypothetical protein n=1 Tax=Allorhizocola rhizosphaerae TaxID=1872709 RepID=UPI000E3DCB77|nr:hypothetical protein [Allorhizocola rhizosphaerae]
MTTPMIAMDELRARLRDLHTHAARPSYRELARMGGHRYAASTIADTLNGRRKRIAWPFVHFFITMCLEHARRHGISVPRQDQQTWWRLWQEQA